MSDTTTELLAALKAISCRAPIMGSTGDYREGQLHALSACADIARAAIAKCPAPLSPAMGEELSVAEIRTLWDASVNGSHAFWLNSHWMRVQIVKFAHALCTLRPASPITQGVQLTDDAIRAAWDAVFAHAQFSKFDFHCDEYQSCVLAFARSLSVPATPEYYKTAEKPPTEADGNAVGDVLVWVESAWIAQHWSEQVRDPQRFAYWMLQPAAPVSPVTAEEAEIERLAQVLWMANDQRSLPYNEAREYDKNIHRKMARAVIASQSSK